MKDIMSEEIVIVDSISFNRYGWKRDTIDDRDLKFQPLSDKLPRTFSLIDKMPPILNQGKLGSCTANAICNAIRFCEMVEGVDNSKSRSRLFVYYNERALEDTTGEDAGSRIRDGIKSVNKLGACFEDEWPYDITLFTERPPDRCYESAKAHRALKYERVDQDINSIKKAINSGFPVVFGISVFSSIEKPTVTKSGIIPLPGTKDSLIGGHCMLCCGWDDSRRLFIIMNSWGEQWGNPRGFGYISYDYLSNPKFSSDFWRITFVK